VSRGYLTGPYGKVHSLGGFYTNTDGSIIPWHSRCGVFLPRIKPVKLKKVTNKNMLCKKCWPEDMRK